MVEVLHAKPYRLFFAFGQLVHSDVAQAEVTQSHCRLSSASTVRGSSIDSSEGYQYRDPQVDDIEVIEPLISKVVMNRIDEFLAQKSVSPRLIVSVAGAHFGDDYNPVRIGMECLLDDPIRQMGAVEVARIDMVHTSFTCFAPNPHCAIDVARRSHTCGPPNCAP